MYPIADSELRIASSARGVPKLWCMNSWPMTPIRYSNDSAMVELVDERDPVRARRRRWTLAMNVDVWAEAFVAEELEVVVAEPVFDRGLVDSARRGRDRRAQRRRPRRRCPRRSP